MAEVPSDWRFWVPVGSAGLLLAIFIGTALDRTSPIGHVEGTPAFAVLHPGDDFDGTWTAQVDRLCNGSLERWVEGGTDGDWFEWQAGLQADFAARVRTVPKLVSYPVTTFRLPPGMPPGPASYHVVGTFRCNRIGHLLFPITVVYPPIPFTVERRP